LSQAFGELLRRQNAERLRLERELLQEEQEALAQLVTEEDGRRHDTVDTLTDNLVSNLHGEAGT